MKLVSILVSACSLFLANCKKNTAESVAQSEENKPSLPSSSTVASAKNPVRFAFAMKPNGGSPGKFPGAPTLEQFIRKFEGGEFKANPASFNDRYTIVTTNPNSISLSNSCALSEGLPFYLDEENVKSNWDSYFAAKASGAKWFQVKVSVDKFPMAGGAYLCDADINYANQTYHLHTSDMEPYFYDSVYEMMASPGSNGGKPASVGTKTGYPVVATKRADGSYVDSFHNLTLQNYIDFWKEFNQKANKEKADAKAKGCYLSWGQEVCPNKGSGVAQTVK